MCRLITTADPEQKPGKNPFPCTALGRFTEKRNSLFPIRAENPFDIYPFAVYIIYVPYPGGKSTNFKNKADMMKNFNDGRDWFFEKRFGLFVHWGIYAVGGLHEQAQQRYGISAAEYEKQMRVFNPVKFDPAAWLDMAEANGMQYMVFTAKHHDGFCMWDTRETAYNVMNTPYGRDILKSLSDECHKRHFPLVIYYSCVDWNNVHYPNIGRHHEITTDPSKHDMAAYMAFLKNQIREICTNYGEIHGIWWDMNVPGHEDESVNALIRSLQPKALVNNRGYSAGDYSTPERSFEASPHPFASAVESCNSVGENSWGFRKDEDYYSIRSLQHQIASILPLGGNFLLNLGPDATGRFPHAAVNVLSGVGSWYNRVKEALTAEPCCGMVNQPGLLTTGSGKAMNVICLEPLRSSNLFLKPFSIMPEKVELLNFPAKVTATLEPVPYTLTLPRVLRLRNIPVEKLYSEVPVFRLTFGSEDIRSKEFEAVKDGSGSVATL